MQNIFSGSVRSSLKHKIEGHTNCRIYKRYNFPPLKEHANLKDMSQVSLKDVTTNKIYDHKSHNLTLFLFSHD